MLCVIAIHMIPLLYNLYKVIKSLISMLYNEESMNKIIIVYYLSMAFPVTTIVTM